MSLAGTNNTSRAHQQKGSYAELSSGTTLGGSNYDARPPLSQPAPDLMSGMSLESASYPRPFDQTPTTQSLHHLHGLEIRQEANQLGQQPNITVDVATLTQPRRSSGGSSKEPSLFASSSTSPLVPPTDSLEFENSPRGDNFISFYFDL
jgi:hypothetical protein